MSTLPGRVCLLIALATVALIAATPRTASAGEILVSAAASLKAAFEEAARGFVAVNPGTTVAFNFGPSGGLAAQIEAGAPADVFASASVRDMDRLAAAGRIDPGTRAVFATNRLVAIVPAASTAPPAAAAGLAGIGGPAFGRIAIGNPATSPAGRYAEQALAGDGVLEAVRSRLVLAETVRQILDWVARGEVDAGVLYATDAATRPEAVRVVAEAAAGDHDPISYPAAVVAGAAEPGAARAFIAHLRSAAGLAALARLGFGPAP